MTVTMLDHPLVMLTTVAGTTFDAIENRFRKIRKEANDLRSKVESGEIIEAPTYGEKATTGPRKAPAKRKDKVAGGRVTKPDLDTSGKRKKVTKKIKEEAKDDPEESQMGDEADVEDAMDVDADSQANAPDEEADYYEAPEVVHKWAKGV